LPTEKYGAHLYLERRARGPKRPSRTPHDLALYFFALFRQKSHNKPPPASANASAPSEHPRAAAARDAARPPTVCRRWGSPKQK